MLSVRIISVENPPGSLQADEPLISHRHSKFIFRRQYVENVLLPQLKRMSCGSVELFPAVVSDGYDGLQELTWLGKTLRLVYQYQVGCFLSHYTLWQWCVENKTTLLILEDDAWLDPDNEAAVAKALKEYDAGDYDGDVLYLLLALPSFPTQQKSYRPSACKQLSPALTRLTSASDLSGSSAYAIKPKAAQALIDWVSDNGVYGVDGIIHRAFSDNSIDMLIMTQYQQGFLLNDHFAQWNHRHDPSLKG